MKKNNKMFISSEHSHQTVHILFIILIYLHILFIMTVHIIFIIRISYLNKPTPKNYSERILWHSNSMFGSSRGAISQILQPRTKVLISSLQYLDNMKWIRLSWKMPTSLTGEFIRFKIKQTSNLIKKLK